MKRNGNCTSNLVRFGRSRELCRCTVTQSKKKRTRHRHEKEVSLDAHLSWGWTEKHSSPIDSSSFRPPASTLAHLLAPPSSLYFLPDWHLTSWTVQFIAHVLQFIRSPSVLIGLLFLIAGDWTMVDGMKRITSHYSKATATRKGSDEDMTPMHMTIFGAWYGGEEDQ